MDLLFLLLQNVPVDEWRLPRPLVQQQIRKPAPSVGPLGLLCVRVSQYQPLPVRSSPSPSLNDLALTDAAAHLRVSLLAPSLAHK